MRRIHSIRIRRALPLIAAAAVAIACSSDSVTGPSTRGNAALILHFDSLKNSTSGERPGIYSQIAQMLALGAPVGTGTITIDGVPKHVNVIGVRLIGVSEGAPFDSGYAVAAWQGDGSDTAITFIQSGAVVTAISAFGDSSAISFGGTGSVVPGALGASCTSFTAPGDIEIPTTISCNLQPATDAFSITLGGGDGPAVTLPPQTVAGIRAEIEAPPPPC